MAPRNWVEKRPDPDDGAKKWNDAKEVHEPGAKETKSRKKEWKIKGSDNQDCNDSQDQKKGSQGKKEWKIKGSDNQDCNDSQDQKKSWNEDKQGKKEWKIKGSDNQDCNDSQDQKKSWNEDKQGQKKEWKEDKSAKHEWNDWQNGSTYYKQNGNQCWNTQNGNDWNSNKITDWEKWQQRNYWNDSGYWKQNDNHDRNNQNGSSSSQDYAVSSKGKGKESGKDSGQGKEKGKGKGKGSAKSGKGESTAERVVKDAGSNAAPERKILTEAERAELRKQAQERAKQEKMKKIAEQGPCPHCGKTDHLAEECRFQNVKCRLCGKVGHLSAVCPEVPSPARTQCRDGEESAHKKKMLAILKHLREHFSIPEKEAEKFARQWRVHFGIRGDGALQSKELFETRCASFAGSIDDDGNMIDEEKFAQACDNIGPWKRSVLDGSKICIQNLPWTTTAAKVRELFSPYGEILLVVGPTSGMAFVSFGSVQEGEDAVEALDETEVDGNIIELSFAKVQIYKEETAAQEDRQWRRINVTNIPAELMNPDRLRELFEPYGELCNWKIVANIDGTYKNYGHVAFAYAEDCKQAFSELQGRKSDDGLTELKLYRVEGLSKSRSKGKGKKGEDRPWWRINVTNIPAELMNPDRLRELFEPYGELCNWKIMVNIDGTFKNYGQVAFASEEDSKQAFSELQGRKSDDGLTELKLQLVEDDDGDGTTPIDYKRLFVRNLPECIRSPEEIEEMFRIHGPVAHVHLPKDDEGACKNFAFVSFLNHEDATHAMAELDGREVSGQKLSVVPASTKKTQTQPRPPGLAAAPGLAPPRRPSLGLYERPGSNGKDKSKGKGKPKGDGTGKGKDERRRSSGDLTMTRADVVCASMWSSMMGQMGGGYQ